jgi:hypothetical protein
VAGSPAKFSDTRSAIGSQSAMMCSSSLRPNCEFCSTGIAPIQMAARNAAAKSAELSIRRSILSDGRTPLHVSSSAKANTLRWKSALLTGPRAVRKAGRAARARSWPGRNANSERFIGNHQPS